MDSGIIVALVTPLNEDESIDVPSLRRLLDWVAAGGVKGVFLAGTIGEGMALRDEVRQTLFCEAASHAKGRMAILANVSDTGTLRAVDAARAAERAGVDVLVATARVGFPQRQKAETRRHIEAIATATALPVWFYENPGTTGVTSDFDALRDLASIPKVKGIKFSSPDRELFARCVRELPGLPVTTGNVEDIAYAGAIGAFGAVSGIGSLVPALCVRVFEAARAGRPAEAEKLQNAISGIYAIYGGKGYPLWPTAQKHALKRRGILRTSVVTAPFGNLTTEQESQVDRVLSGLDESLFAPA
jgi:4-hydroxy-tetrahydrodipicolinate synthase